VFVLKFNEIHLLNCIFFLFFFCVDTHSSYEVSLSGHTTQAYIWHDTIYTTSMLQTTTITERDERHNFFFLNIYT
jgi:hypothetical protein